MQSFSQKKRQQMLLDSGFLDLNNDNLDDFKGFSGDAVATALYNVAEQFIQQAVTNLNDVDRVATGSLEESIKPTDIIVMGKVMSININVFDYYKFIDKGVKGWKSQSPGDSPYGFKPQGKRGSAPKNSKMVAAIKQWLLKEGLKSKGAENKHPISSREARRNKITDATTSMAIKTTLNIRKYGLKKTNFWTKTEGQIQDYVAKEFETALQIDIINSLTNGNK